MENPQVDEGDEPPLCSWCGLPIEDEADVELEAHFGCDCQRDATDDLREKLESILRDLHDTDAEYRWERKFGSAAGAPEKDGAALVAKIEAAIIALRG